MHVHIFCWKNENRSTYNVAICLHNRLPYHLSNGSFWLQQAITMETNEVLKWGCNGWNESILWLYSAFLTRKGSNEKTCFSQCSRQGFHVMNSLVAYTLQKEIQHVCQGYLGKSHSLVCGSVAFYYLPQSFKSNSISSLLPGTSLSVQREHWIVGDAVFWMERP